MAALWRWYLSILTRQPLISKYLSHRMTTGMLITAGGDLLAQMYESPSDLNFHRIRYLALYGCFFVGGVGHFWYRGLDRLFGAELTLGRACKKTVCELLQGALDTVMFVGWAHGMSGSDKALGEKYKQDLGGMLKVGACFWVPVDLANFMLVPEPLRVLYVSVMATAWYGFLSYASHNELTQKTKEDSS